MSIKPFSFFIPIFENKNENFYYHSQNLRYEIASQKQENEIWEIWEIWGLFEKPKTLEKYWEVSHWAENISKCEKLSSIKHFLTKLIVAISISNSIIIKKFSS